MTSRFAAIAWTAVRVTFGLSMALLHGHGKVFGGNVTGLTRTVGELGFPAPEFFAWAAALSEFVGGLLVALGLATRAAAAAVCCVMGVALYRHLGQGFERMELALLYLAVMAMAVAVGGGPYALDRFAKLRLPIGPRSSA